MNVVATLRRRLGPPLPARDLVFVDALAVVAAVFVFVCAPRIILAVDHPLTWARIWPLVRHAIPLSVTAMLLSAAAAGLYGERAARASLAEQIAPVAYAVAIVIGAFIYYSGASPPVWMLLIGVVAALVLVPLGRWLYWRVAGAGSSP